MKKQYVLLVAVVLVGFVSWYAYSMLHSESGNLEHVVAVRSTEHSPVGATGAEVFAANCALCHGERAGGSGNGPPLVHKIYEPGHHPDEAVMRAVFNGVRAHHWELGDMPPVEGVSIQEAAAVTVYLRELQSANGID